MNYDWFYLGVGVLLVAMLFVCYHVVDSEPKTQNYSAVIALFTLLLGILSHHTILKETLAGVAILIGSMICSRWLVQSSSWQFKNLTLVTDSLLGQIFWFMCGLSLFACAPIPRVLCFFVMFLHTSLGLMLVCGYHLHAILMSIVGREFTRSK